jgi:hypothetical protein
VLVRAVGGALDLDLPGALPGSAARSGLAGIERDNDAPDDPATWGDEASRLAKRATDWVGTTVEPVGLKVTSAMETSGSWIQHAEDRGWAALQSAGSGSLAALQSARELILQRAMGGMRDS